MSGAASQQQEEDKKPNDGGAHINLQVKGQGGEVIFRIKRSTQLKKLMNAYCDRQSVEINSISFVFDGRHLRGEQTPDELEMEDGDEIVAMLHQRCSGGCRERERKEEREMSGAASQQQEEDKKPNEGGAHINLKVKGQGGNEVFFRIKRSTKLKKLLNPYCDRQSVEINSIAFLFDGLRLRGEQTPDELEMKDGDEIVAMLHQRCSGGCREREREEEREMSGAASQQQEEDKKPNEGGARINLKVKGQGGNEVFFSIKRSTKLKKLMNAYCDRQSVEINSIAFLFDSLRLRGEHTPDELEMEDGDEIVATLH